MRQRIEVEFEVDEYSWQRTAHVLPGTTQTHFGRYCQVVVEQVRRMTPLLNEAGGTITTKVLKSE